MPVIQIEVRNCMDCPYYEDILVGMCDYFLPYCNEFNKQLDNSRNIPEDCPILVKEVEDEPK